MIPAMILAGILGQPVPDWPAKPANQWIQGGPLTLAGLRGKVVLIRFFMDSECPYCRKTAPSLNALYEEFAGRGLVVIGMYTPKPKPHPIAADKVREYVASYGFRFPVAVDAEWGALNALWLDRVPGAEFTSASLLIDKHGVLRHIHEGGVFAKDAADPKAKSDYDALHAAIVELLSEPAP
jgi:peroxiredoxin